MIAFVITALFGTMFVEILQTGYLLGKQKQLSPEVVNWAHQFPRLTTIGILITSLYILPPLFKYGVSYSRAVRRKNYRTFSYELDYFLTWAIAAGAYFFYLHSAILTKPSHYAWWALLAYFYIFGFPRLRQSLQTILSIISIGLTDQILQLLLRNPTVPSTNIFILIPIASVLIFGIFPWNMIRYIIFLFTDTIPNIRLVYNFLKKENIFQSANKDNLSSLAKLLVNRILLSIPAFFLYPFRKYKKASSATEAEATNLIMGLFNKFPGLNNEDKALRVLTKIIRETLGFSTPYILNDSENSTIDLLNRSVEIERLYKKISGYFNSSKTTAPLTIGICGEWGDGKSVFVNMLFNKVDSEETNIVCIKSHPWRYFLSSDQNSALCGFFGDIEAALSEKIRSKKISKLIKKYVGLLIKNSGISTNRLSLGLGAFSDQSSYEEITNNIKNELNKTGYKLLIAIEDLDRMGLDELIKTLRLIRACDYMQNVIFLLPYDKARINKVLSKGDYPPTYLEKFVQNDVYLAPINRSILKDYIAQELKDRFCNEDVADDINTNENDITEAIDGVFENGASSAVIRNLRHAKKLLNGVLFSYDTLHQEVSFADFIELEMIKIFLPEIYADILTDTKYYFPDSLQFYSYESLLLGHEKKLSESCREHLQKVIKENRYSDLQAEVTFSLIEGLFPHFCPDGFPLDADKEQRKYRLNDSRFFARYFSGLIPANQLANVEFRALVDRVLKAGSRTQRITILKQELSLVIEAKKMDDFEWMLHSDQIEKPAEFFNVYAHTLIQNESTLEIALELSHDIWDNIVGGIIYCLTLSPPDTQKEILDDAMKRLSLFRASKLLNQLNWRVTEKPSKEFSGINKEYRAHKQKELWDRFKNEFISSNVNLFTALDKERTLLIWYSLSSWKEDNISLAAYASRCLKEDPKTLDVFASCYINKDGFFSRDNMFEYCFSSNLQEELKKLMAESSTFQEKLEPLFKSYGEYIGRKPSA